MIDRRKFLQYSGGSLAACQLAACGPDKMLTAGIARSGFNRKSTAEDVTAGIDLSGKLAVVTGCTSGIGFETMRVLAARGAYVIGTSRSLDRAAEAGVVRAEVDLCTFHRLTQVVEHAPGVFPSRFGGLCFVIRLRRLDDGAFAGSALRRGFSVERLGGLQIAR